MLQSKNIVLLLLGCMTLLPSCRDSQSARKHEEEVRSSQTVNKPLRETDGASKEKTAAVPKDLEELQEHFLRAIKEKNAHLFLGFVSDDGIYLGVDSEKLPKKDVAREIRMRKGVYCLLFDSACLRAETHDETCSYSYSEMLSDLDKLKISTSLGHYQNTPQAEITVSVRDYRCPSNPEMLNFIFNRERSGWRLVAIPYT
jgi:hypothetical protein